MLSLLSFDCQLDTAKLGRQSNGHCENWVGLWPCLLKTVLTDDGCGNMACYKWHPPQARSPAQYKTGCIYSLFFLDGQYDVTRCSSSCLDFPEMMDYNMKYKSKQTNKQSNFPLLCCFLRVCIIATKKKREYSPFQHFNNNKECINLLLCMF